MKDWNLLVWLTQLGLSVAVPPVVCILLARWAQDHWGWGNWVLWAGIILGVLLAIDGLRASLKMMERLSHRKQDDSPSDSFNDHN